MALVSIGQRDVTLIADALQIALQRFQVLATTGENVETCAIAADHAERLRQLIPEIKRAYRIDVAYVGRVR